MVTKPTGKPVGRPRKPRPPRRVRAGRPTLPFRNDPDRYAVALLDAMLALEMGTGRACAIGIAAWQVGIEGDAPRVSDDGRIVKNWERERTKRGSLAGTLEGRALTLRSKQRRCRSADESQWRKAIASAFMLALRAPDRGASKRTILERADGVGEREFARRVMVQMLEEKLLPTPSPEFPSNFVSRPKAR